MSVKPIPDGYHSMTPYLTIDGAAKAIEFYTKVFGATELLRLPGPDGKLGHAEIRIGDSVLMMADESPQMGNRSPKSIGGSPVGIMLYVENSDHVFAKAVAAGATVDRPIEDQFYGDRSGTVVDPFGYKWTISTHIEDVSPEEMNKRIAALFGPKS
ncbi:MAG TPA: VOC family protein [Terriglobales bacterium]|jgi:PhnB protein|nr:VOC family protein [Terriglobales bacterium]